VKGLSALLLAVALAGGVACSSSEAGAGGVTEVTATDTSCKPAKTDFAAGKQTFEVDNKGSKVTEMYVYGHKDKVIAEVENIGPGTSRRLTVDLKAGDYELACKPGQTGDGIRAPIKVKGEGGTDSAGNPKADRDVEVVGEDYKFIGLENFSAKAGETDDFTLINKGKEKHELEMLGPDGKAIGEIEPVDPGKNGEATFTFKDPGTYTYVCGIEGHEAKGMKGTFTVS
jgi:uncharacterized cupredoxin-like copper-binding protein